MAKIRINIETHYIFDVFITNIKQPGHQPPRRPMPGNDTVWKTKQCKLGNHLPWHVPANSLNGPAARPCTCRCTP